MFYSDLALIFSQQIIWLSFATGKPKPMTVIPDLFSFPKCFFIRKFQVFIIKILGQSKKLNMKIDQIGSLWVSFYTRNTDKYTHFIINYFIIQCFGVCSGNAHGWNRNRNQKPSRCRIRHKNCKRNCWRSFWKINQWNHFIWIKILSFYTWRYLGG